MPTGPKGERRPADVIGNAVKVMRIATGEIVDETDARNELAVARGHAGGVKGGAARSKSLTPAQRKDIAKRAAEKRWQKSHK
jgi:hypothetical protein